jgi:hypothetical protein
VCFYQLTHAFLKTICTSLIAQILGRQEEVVPRLYVLRSLLMTCPYRGADAEAERLERLAKSAALDSDDEDAPSDASSSLKRVAGALADSNAASAANKRPRSVGITSASSASSSSSSASAGIAAVPVAASDRTYSLAALQRRVQASDAQLAAGLRELDALEIDEDVAAAADAADADGESADARMVADGETAADGDDIDDSSKHARGGSAPRRRWRVLAPAFVDEVFDLALSTLAELSLPIDAELSAARVARVCASLLDYPAFVVEHVMRMHALPPSATATTGATGAGSGSGASGSASASSDAASSSSVSSSADSSASFVLDAVKVARFRAVQIFRARAPGDHFPADRFIDGWASMLPRGVAADPALLRGVALLEQHPTLGAAYRHVPREALPPTAAARFAALLNERPKWALDEIEPYIRCVVRDRVLVRERDSAWHAS